MRRGNTGSERTPLRSRVLEQSTSRAEGASQNKTYSNEDTLDPETGAHINKLMDDMSRMPRLERMNLTTREGALEAIQVIDKAQSQINEHRKVVKALKSMLNQRGS